MSAEYIPATFADIAGNARALLDSGGLSAELAECAEQILDMAERAAARAETEHEA